VYREEKPPRKIDTSKKVRHAELVAMLQSPNGFQRDLAQQMCIGRT